MNIEIINIEIINIDGISPFAMQMNCAYSISVTEWEGRGLKPWEVPT